MVRDPASPLDVTFQPKCNWGNEKKEQFEPQIVQNVSVSMPTPVLKMFRGFSVFFIMLTNRKINLFVSLEEELFPHSCLNHRSCLVRWRSSQGWGPGRGPNNKGSQTPRKSCCALFCSQLVTNISSLSALCHRWTAHKCPPCPIRRWWSSSSVSLNKLAPCVSVKPVTFACLSFFFFFSFSLIFSHVLCCPTAGTYVALTLQGPPPSAASQPLEPLSNDLEPNQRALQGGDAPPSPPAPVLFSALGSIPSQRITGPKPLQVAFFPAHYHRHCDAIDNYCSTSPRN